MTDEGENERPGEGSGGEGRDGEALCARETRSHGEIAEAKVGGGAANEARARLTEDTL